LVSRGDENLLFCFRASEGAEGSPNDITTFARSPDSMSSKWCSREAIVVIFGVVAIVTHTAEFESFGIGSGEHRAFLKAAA
jgi:hypothetical protein